MPKVNFEKIEQLLELGIRAFGVKQLLHLADLSTSFGTDAGPRQTSAFDDQEIRAISLMTLAQNLRDLSKRDKSILENLGVNKKQFKKYIDDPSALTPEDWEQISNIRKKLGGYRKEIQEKFKQITDDDIIKSERKKHINKRFNVNEKWLPLH